MNLDNQLSILREHESDCYTICLMILRSEEMAARAAKKALLQLWTHEAFMQMDPSERPGVLKSVSIRWALEFRKSAGRC
ncbi:hypothetical protein [Paenibacillus puerhi]|uniref:hypothetical protein n=1 Tax=Paenibacillus puerhi TaxID=2692622 RepID=UPI00135AE134|nr:hypothetical protein [Paenibacillus puerhi]